MVLRNSRFMTNDAAMPLTRGRIQLQSEAAEVYYKDVEIQPIEAMPREYEPLFR